MSTCNVLIDDTIALVDHSHIELLVGPDFSGSRELLEDLIDLYEAENAPQLASFAESVAEKNVDAAIRQIHFVAGSSGNMGLARLSSYCRAAERAMRDDSELEIEKIRESMNTLYTQSISAYRELL